MVEFIKSIIHYFTLSIKELIYIKNKYIRHHNNIKNIKILKINLIFHQNQLLNLINLNQH